MPAPKFVIRQEQPADRSAVAALAALAMGPGRFARTAYRLREGVTAVAALCLVAEHGERVAGAIRFTEISIGGTGGALLLGPLIVAPDLAGQGCGRGLIREGLERARAHGDRLVLLVGDLAYYQRSGFERCPPGRIMLPGPVDPRRLLAAELEPGALEGYSGLVRGGNPGG